MDTPSKTVEALFRLHNPALVKFLAVRLHSSHEAREVAQEAYLRLLELDQPPDPEFLRDTLFRIAINLANDRLRHRRVRERTQALQIHDRPDSAPAPERVIGARQELLMLQQLLEELPDKCRIAYLAYRLEDKSQGEIAEELEVSPRMIRKYLSRALVHIQLRTNGATLEDVQEHLKRD